MKRTVVLLLGCLSLLGGCLPTVEITNSWVNPAMQLAGPKHQSVFIMALTKNKDARNKIEESLAKVAAKKGYKVIKSGDVIAEIKQPPDTASVVATIKQSGATAAFIVALLNSANESRFVQGTGVYAPPMNSYFTDFGGYYQRTSVTVSTPGYYTEEKVYYLESNIYNVADGKLVWSAQSESYKPDGLRSFSKNFSAAMIRQLEKDGILKK